MSQQTAVQQQSRRCDVLARTKAAKLPYALPSKSRFITHGSRFQLLQSVDVNEYVAAIRAATAHSGRLPGLIYRGQAPQAGRARLVRWVLSVVDPRHCARASTVCSCIFPSQPPSLPSSSSRLLPADDHLSVKKMRLRCGNADLTGSTGHGSD